MAASSSSAAADSLPPWVLLNRLARVWDDADKEDADEATAVKLLCSTTPSTLSVARSVHPDRDNYDRHPYIVAYDAGGLLLHISTTPSIGFNLQPNPEGSFLIVPARGFIPAIAGEFVLPAASILRVPERLGMPAISSIKAMGLLSRLGTRSIEYMVAELQGDEDEDEDGSSARLFRFRSGSDTWVEGEFRCPGFNPRCVDQVISHEGRLWWVDLGKVILGCNPFEHQLVWLYQDLPDGVANRDKEGPQWAWNNIEKKRCVTVSNGMLRFLELTAAGTNADAGDTTVTMWTLVSDPENGSTSWIREYKIDVCKIWQDCAYKMSRLPLEMPVVTIVHPNKAEMLYFFVDGRLISLDVGQNKLLEVITNFSPFSLVDSWNEAFTLPPLSWRYLMAWELSDSEHRQLCTMLSENAILEDDGSVAGDLRPRRSLKRLCWQGVKAAQFVASEVGVGASSLGSKLLYLNEECNEAKMYFKHISQFKASGDGYVATVAGKSAKASKKISKVFGGASLALSYGGTALNSMGFTLQQLHPKAQTGTLPNVITEEITVESVEQAQEVIIDWHESQDSVSVDVPSHMETDMAVEIMQRFKEAGALVLVENSPVLREKAAAVLDTDWHIV